MPRWLVSHSVCVFSLRETFVGGENRNLERRGGNPTHLGQLGSFQLPYGRGASGYIFQGFFFLSKGRTSLPQWSHLGAALATILQLEERLSLVMAKFTGPYKSFFPHLWSPPPFAAENAKENCSILSVSHQLIVTYLQMSQPDCFCPLSLA